MDGPRGEPGPGARSLLCPTGTWLPSSASATPGPGKQPPLRASGMSGKHAHPAPGEKAPHAAPLHHHPHPPPPHLPLHAPVLHTLTSVSNRAGPRLQAVAGRTRRRSAPVPCLQKRAASPEIWAQHVGDQGPPRFHSQTSCQVDSLWPHRRGSGYGLAAWPGGSSWGVEAPGPETLRSRRGLRWPTPLGRVSAGGTASPASLGDPQALGHVCPSPHRLCWSLQVCGSPLRLCGSPPPRPHDPLWPAEPSWPEVPASMASPEPSTASAPDSTFQAEERGRRLCLEVRRQADTC